MFNRASLALALSSSLFSHSTPSLTTCATSRRARRRTTSRNRMPRALRLSLRKWRRKRPSRSLSPPQRKLTFSESFQISIWTRKVQTASFGKISSNGSATNTELRKNLQKEKDWRSIKHIDIYSVKQKLIKKRILSKSRSSNCNI